MVRMDAVFPRTCKICTALPGGNIHNICISWKFPDNLFRDHKRRNCIDNHRRPHCLLRSKRKIHRIKTITFCLFACFLPSRKHSHTRAKRPKSLCNRFSTISVSRHKHFCLINIIRTFFHKLCDRSLRRRHGIFLRHNRIFHKIQEMNISSG